MRLHCPENCEPRNEWVCWDDLRGHDFVKKLEVDGVPCVEIECCNCRAPNVITEEEWRAINRQDDLDAQRRRRAGLTRYPYIEPHTGELVKSKEHREEVLARHGYHKAEHGLDERYNDELCEKLRSERIAKEDRRKAIRQKRETLIREGVIKLRKKA